MKTWNQCGLSSRALEVLRKAEFEAPLAIQVHRLSTPLKLHWCKLACRQSMSVGQRRRDAWAPGPCLIMHRSSADFACHTMAALAAFPCLQSSAALLQQQLSLSQHAGTSLAGHHVWP